MPAAAGAAGQSAALGEIPFILPRMLLNKNIPRAQVFVKRQVIETVFAVRSY
jgi:hypothetical protein